MKENINIGLFIDTFYPMLDGVINVVDNYARQLNEIEGVNVIVFAPKSRLNNFDDKTLPYSVVRCKRINLKMLRLDYDLPTPKFDKHFKKILKESKLDIIHIHSPFSIGRMAANYGKKHNIPVVGTFHSQFKKDFYKSTKSKLMTKILLKKIMRVFNKCDVLWTMNPACVELAKSYGYRGRVEIIPNATNLSDKFDADELSAMKLEIRKKYNISSEEKVFINIGRLNKLKNLDFVIEVCKKLKDENFKFKLLLIGDGNEKKYFVNKVEKLGLENEIVFVGKITSTEEKSKYFASADLQIFPSYYDTDGIVRIEAAAFCVPTIMIKNSIASSTICDNINGYIGENDIDAFAKKIIDIFANKSIYERVKEKCHEDLYINWEGLVLKVFENYKQLIEVKKCEKI